jgi:serine/threonine protein kinase
MHFAILRKPWSVIGNWLSCGYCGTERWGEQVSPERIRQVKEIVDAARQLKGQARDKYLQRIYRDDADLRREVEPLLAEANQLLPQPVSPFEPGSTILHYRVIEKIGVGGMGEVFKAEDLKLGRVVALKAMHTAERCDKIARKRLLQEARSASALNHPNIITIHAIEQAGSEDAPLDFLVMEYLEGESLSVRIRRAPLDVKFLCELSVQVADVHSPE